jgi:hypothetical protein
MWTNRDAANQPARSRSNLCWQWYSASRLTIPGQSTGRGSANRRLCRSQSDHVDRISLHAASISEGVGK